MAKAIYVKQIANGILINNLTAIIALGAEKINTKRHKRLLGGLTQRCVGLCTILLCGDNNGHSRSFAVHNRKIPDHRYKQTQLQESSNGPATRYSLFSCYKQHFVLVKAENSCVQKQGGSCCMGKHQARPENKNTKKKKISDLTPPQWYNKTEHQQEQKWGPSSNIILAFELRWEKKK